MLIHVDIGEGYSRFWFSLEPPALSFEFIKTADKICNIDLPVRRQDNIMTMAVPPTLPMCHMKMNSSLV